MNILIQTAKNFFFLILIIFIFCWIKLGYGLITRIINKFKNK